MRDVISTACDPAKPTPHRAGYGPFFGLPFRSTAPWRSRRVFWIPHTPLPDDATLLSFWARLPGHRRRLLAWSPMTRPCASLLGQHCRDDRYLGSSARQLWLHRQLLLLAPLRPATPPREPDVVVRVHTSPGEEAHADFGPVAAAARPCLRSFAHRLRLCGHALLQPHQFAELVFDQKAPTWIACHRHAFEG